MLIVTVTGVEVQGAWATPYRHALTRPSVRAAPAYMFAATAAAADVDRAQDYYNQTASMPSQS
jgi:hypothetical protein